MRVSAVTLVAFFASYSTAFVPLRVLKQAAPNKLTGESPATRIPWGEGGVIIRDDRPDKKPKLAQEGSLEAEKEPEPKIDSSLSDDKLRPPNNEPRPKKWLVPTTPRPIGGRAESTKTVPNVPMTVNRTYPARRRTTAMPEWAVPATPVTQRRAAEFMKQLPAAVAPKGESSVPIDKVNSLQATAFFAERTVNNEDYLPNFFPQMNQQLSSQPTKQVRSGPAVATRRRTDLSKPDALGVKASNALQSPPNADTEVDAASINGDTRNESLIAPDKVADGRKASRQKSVSKMVLNTDLINGAESMINAGNTEPIASTLTAPKKKWLSSLREREPDENVDSKSSPVVGQKSTGSTEMDIRVASEVNAPKKKWLSSLRRSEPNKSADSNFSPVVGQKPTGSAEGTKSSISMSPNRTMQPPQKPAVELKVDPKPVHAVDAQSRDRSVTSTPASAATSSRPGILDKEKATVSISNEETYAENSRKLERRVSMLRERNARLAKERANKEHEERKSTTRSTPVELQKKSKIPVGEEQKLTGRAAKVVQSNRTSVERSDASAAKKEVATNSTSILKTVTNGIRPDPTEPKDWSKAKATRPTGMDPWIQLTWPGAKEEDAAAASTRKTPKADISATITSSSSTPISFPVPKMKATIRTTESKSVMSSGFFDKKLARETLEKAAEKRREEVAARLVAAEEEKRIHESQEKAKRESYVKQRALLGARLNAEKQQAMRIVENNRKALEIAHIAAETEAKHIQETREKVKRESYLKQKALLSARFEIEEQEARKSAARQRIAIEAARVQAETEAQLAEARRQTYVKHRALLAMRFEIEKQAAKKLAERQRIDIEEARVAAETEAERIEARRRSYIKQRALLSARLEMNRMSQAEDSTTVKTEATQAKERVLDLERELRDIQSQIAETQRRFEEGRDAWASQDISFALQIADLTNKFQASDKDFKKSVVAVHKANQQRTVQLEKQLKKLKGTLEDVRKALHEDPHRTKDTCAGLAHKFGSQMHRLDDIKHERDSKKAEADRFRAQLEDERAELRETDKQRVKQKRDFAADKKDLETRIYNERTKLKKLAERLRIQKKSHKNENAALKERLAQERVKRSDPNLKQELEAELKAEIRMFTNEKKRLESKIKDEERARDVKNRQLSRRKDAIRKELTNIWHGAKDSAMSERQAIIAKYEAQLSVVKNTLKRLQNKKQTLKDVRILTDDVVMLTRKRKEEEAAFVRELTAKNDIISDLEGNAPTLKSELRRRDKLIEEYETDFCKILKQSVKLCREYFQA